MSVSPLISVVDDDASVRVSLEGLIRSLGYRVASFDCASAFLASETRGETACVISDVQMPGMTGFELAQTLRAEAATPPVILMSAFADEGARARADQAGAVCFLKKPFSGDSLIGCIERALAA